MKRTTAFRLLIFAILTILFWGCGRGDKPEPAPPTRAVVTLATLGQLQSGPTGTRLIGAIDLTIILPDGVTVRAKPDGSKLVTEPDVVVPTGVVPVENSMILATYTTATGGMSGSLNIYFMNGAGFGTGNFVKINCDISPGTNPTSANTTFYGFAPMNWDDGSPIPTGPSGLNVAISSITLLQ